MDKSGKIYKTYVQTLKEELIHAMGCTEPIAIAYAAAKAREVLGCEPDLVKICVSNNIIKNVKSVVVPNTDGMKGIEAAAVAGILGGNATHLRGHSKPESCHAAFPVQCSHLGGGHRQRHYL